MRTKPPVFHSNTRVLRGFTLIELMVFIVVVSIALGALMRVYQQAVSTSVDPIIRVRLLELAQSKLDEVMVRKFDHNTPSGGIPACDSSGGGASANCTLALGREGTESCASTGSLNDVDDFHNCADSPYANYSREVVVSYAGTELGLASNNSAKRIQVTVTLTGVDVISLSAYRANF